MTSRSQLAKLNDNQLEQIRDRLKNELVNVEKEMEERSRRKNTSNDSSPMDILNSIFGGLSVSNNNDNNDDKPKKAKKSTTNTTITTTNTSEATKARGSKLDDVTVAVMKKVLKKNNVEVPSTAKRADIEQIVRTNNLVTACVSEANK